MEFKFKRKYDNIFLFALITAIIAVGLTIFINMQLDNNVETINEKISALSYTLILVTFVIINLTFYSLTKRRYFISKERIYIKRSLVHDIVIKYDDIARVIYDKKGRLFLTFGYLPSCTIIYRDKSSNKEKKITIRTNRTELFYKMIENESNIHKLVIKNS